MNHSFVATGALATLACLAACAATLPAQSLTATVSAASDILLTTRQVGQSAQKVTVPAGTLIGSGIILEDQTQQGAQGILRSYQNQNRQGVHVELSCSASTAHGHAGAAAGLGRVELLVELTLQEPLTIEISWFAWMISCANAPGGFASIDIGNDGSVELVVETKPSSFTNAGDSRLFRMPAGTTPVLLTAELNLPAVADPLGRVAEVITGISIKPTHANIRWEGPQCQSALRAHSLLDGETVSFWADNKQLGDLPLLVFGHDRASLTLPVTPNCQLLVTPDVIVPMAYWSYTSLPLGALGPGELFVQGVILRPQQAALSPIRVLTTQRGAVELR